MGGIYFARIYIEAPWAFVSAVGVSGMLRSALARLFITHERNDNKLEVKEEAGQGMGGDTPCIKRLISTQRPRVPSIRPGLRLQGKPGYRGLSAIYGAESLIRYRYGGGGGGVS